MIKNIIFDIGNVLTDFRWREFLHDKGMEYDLVEKIGKVTVESKFWPEYDRGVWDIEKIMDGFVSLAPELAKEIHKGFDDFTGMVTIRDYACDWVRELKDKGFKVFYLSNFSDKAKTECSECLDFIPLMDGGILSYEDKLIKPDHAIYNLLLDRYNLVAEECIFIDDTFVNVEAANEVGIHGIHFVSKKQVEADIEDIVRGNCI